ncbi:MAG: 3-deoxy-7-phosphoheptulonate synthase [Polyangiaceae bacterium]
MHPDSSALDVARVTERVRALGLTPHPIPGAQRVAIGVTGNGSAVDAGRFTDLPGVVDVVSVSQPFKLVSREMQPEDTIVDVAGVRIGGGSLTLIAGPCAVESRDQILEAARRVAASGASLLRGGAYKPRTSPYEFQGLREEGLELLALARRETGLPIVTEAKDVESLERVAEVVDLIQIGARNMQNFALLEKVGAMRKPVLLKRGLSATLKELLMAAEYILARGNRRVVLCERGIRTFETATRNTLDINAIPVLKRLTHLPVLVDPSHATGVRAYVPAAGRAAIAAGADGLIVEVHPNPEEALSDGPQSLTPPEFDRLARDARAIAHVIGRAA